LKLLLLWKFLPCLFGFLFCCFDINSFIFESFFILFFFNFSNFWNKNLFGKSESISSKIKFLFKKVLLLLYIFSVLFDFDFSFWFSIFSLENLFILCFVLSFSVSNVGFFFSFNCSSSSILISSSFFFFNSNNLLKSLWEKKPNFLLSFFINSFFLLKIF